MDDISQHENDIRRTEAVFRYGAALPVRDDFEQDLYRESSARHSWRPGFMTYGCAQHLHSLTPGQLRQLGSSGPGILCPDVSAVLQ